MCNEKNVNFGRDYIEFIVRIFLNDVEQLRKQMRKKRILSHIV